MTFTPLFKTTSEPQKNQQYRSRSAALGVIFKDALPIETLFAIGATLNGLLFLAIGRIALLIPAVFLAAKLGNALLIANGIKPNPFMSNVINGKFSAQFPNDDGTFGPKPAAKSVTVLLIGARSNHPMGPMAPGFKEMGQHMGAMQKDISERADEYGLINSSLWMGAERASGNEVMYVMYFRDIEGLHRYAHDDLHRKAWNWWNATYKKHPYMSIWHEAFVSPAGAWETIYANSHPTLLGGGSVPIKTEADARWTSTIVDASKGPLRSSRGRMARTDGSDNDKYGLDPYLQEASLPGEE